jgi:two-component system, chemotaxis family, chemotaxis protein CheY
MARILVIEDDELVRATITRMLEDGGHSVTVAVDGNDGLLQFRRAPFDLVISDVFMPNKNGIEMLRELRQIDVDVPVIMMSAGIPEAWRVAGLTDEDYLRMTALLGATRTLDKPFKSRDVLALIQEVLGDRAS